MKTPNTDHYEGFFHGMAHALAVAEKHRATKPKAHADAILDDIRRERVTLGLMNELQTRQGAQT